MTNNICAAYPGYVLMYSATGNAVKNAQYYLNLMHQKYASIPVITVDGVFGKATQTATIAFQKAVGLQADGKIGPATWNKFGTEVMSCEFYPNFVSYGGTTMQQGSTINQVRDVQVFLTAIPEKYSAIAALKADGIFGSGTKQSVMVFQSINGLKIDGIVGPATYSKVGSVYIGLFK